MKYFTVFNPYNHTLIDKVPYSSRESVLAQIHEMEKKRLNMKSRPFFERANLLKKVASLLLRDKEKLAHLITEEMGKPMTDSLIEVTRAITTFELAAEESTRIKGESLHSDALPPRREKHGLIDFFPLGIIFCITPFNFPVNLAAHKIAPGLAAGNNLLIKPHPQTYLSTKHLVSLCHEAGFTTQDVSIVFVAIDDLTQILPHPFIKAINFTGGKVAAEAITRVAGVKKMLFELGGNDPLIVLKDGDIERAVEASILHRFRLAGQRCNACKKVFIHEDKYEDYKSLLIQKTKILKVGNPLLLETDVGPLVSKDACDLIKARLSNSLQHGAQILLGGQTEGNFIWPTILENVSMTCDISMYETFGPLLPLHKFSHAEEVISTLRENQMGLQAGVFTNDMEAIKLFYQSLEVGSVIVNEGPGFRLEHFPFGGVGSSGVGREGLYYAIREMSTIKSLIF